jgi:hypothetical protein
LGLSVFSESVISCGRKYALYIALIKSNMVCDSCQSKVKKIIVPDKWKDGSRNSVVKAGKTNKVYFFKDL